MKGGESMVKRIVVPLIVITLLSCSLIVCEGPRGPLCNPFRPSVENHIWFWWPEGIAGFEFDDNGRLLYIVDGVPAQYGELVSSSVQAEFQMLPFSGEFTYWHPIKKGGLGGFWLKHYAVKVLSQPWGTVSAGVDGEYRLEGGKHIKEATREDFKWFKDEPFDAPLTDYAWMIEKDELYGIQFDTNGYAQYLVHGISGTYSLNDVPKSGEYTVWYPAAPKSKEGYWLKHTAIKAVRTSHSTITQGVDLTMSSQYNLKDLTRKHLTGYTDTPFAQSLKNHLWNLENDHLYGFQFDDKGNLLYLVDGIPGEHSLDDVPYSGEYTVWYPVAVLSQQGYWLRYTAVRSIEMPWGEVAPGIDYSYQAGRSIQNLFKSTNYTYEFPGLDNYIWKRTGDGLLGAQFDEKGRLRYLVHGVPGTYSLNDVPLSGEYVVWFPTKKGADEGYWLKHVAVSEFDMEWGHITYGVDLYYYQEEGHGISWLTRDHYDESWDLRKLIKYLWDYLNE
jgi:hypothetical protein